MNELHDKDWNLLKEKGLTLGEMVKIRSCFASIYANEYPFVSQGPNNYFHSTIEDLKSLEFDTKNEVILANAIYENVKNNFEMNSFIQMLKYSFRILGVNSAWK